MTEAVETKPKKKETVYTDVKMSDGRTEKFPGDQKVKKSILFDDETKFAIGVRYDFRHGQFLQLMLSELGPMTQAYAAAHGLSQKVGDEWSDVKTGPEDMMMAGEELIKRLKVASDDGWFAEREAGDSTAGASIVIKALMEVTKKTSDEIKAFLDKKIEAAKANGQKLTRQALYASFRNPTSKTGAVIRRLEEEKASKQAAVDADATLGELMAEPAAAETTEAATA